MIDEAQLLLIFFVIGVGTFLFWRIARRQKREWTVRSFFLGGGKLGTDLTENNTIGITFAWSGGTWYFAWLAYQYGPWVLVSQIFWCVSIIVLALLLPRIIGHVTDKTIHGFLGDNYGLRTQRVAAVATTIGYFINAGFEVFWSSLLLSESLGVMRATSSSDKPWFPLVLALLLVVFVATYCTIGGYRANATVEKLENILGVLSLGALVVLVTRQLMLGSAFSFGVSVFCAGALLYTVVSLFMYKPGNQQHSGRQGVLAILFAVCAFVVVFGVLRQTSTMVPSVAGLVHNTFSIPPAIIVNTVLFQIFFNVIDMQNWQQIAANAELPKKEHRRISASIIRGALYLIWFPGLGGVLLGCALRGFGHNLTDRTLFPSAFQLVLPGASDIPRGLVLGLILLGFLSTSLSTVGDLLMSAVQTISSDILWPTKIRTLLATADRAAELTLISKARRMMIPIAVGMVLSFFLLWRLYPGPVFNFQAMMYAVPLSLLTPVLFALFGRNPSEARGQWPAFLAILISILAVIAMFVLSVLPGVTDTQSTWLISLMPVVANGLSLILFAGLYLLRGITAKGVGDVRKPA